MKKILLSLICLISAIAINAETTVDITFKDQGYTNAQEIKSVNLDENIKVTFDKGSSTNEIKYYNTGTAIRLYAGNKMAIVGVDEGVTIRKVTLKVGSSNKLNSASTVTVGTINNIGDTKPFISDINSNTVTLTHGGSSGHVRIESMEVVYEVSSDSQVATPAITPNGGEVSATDPISISCATEGASIYYTIDGSEPTAENGTLYEAPFTLAEAATVKAIAVAEDLDNSSVAEASFTLLGVSNVTFDFTKPSSLNPVQDEPALGQSKEIVVNNTVFTAGNVSLSFNKGTAGTDCRIWAGTSAYDLRTYNGSSITISVIGADITNIVFTGDKASRTQMKVNVGEFKGKTWTGSAQSVVFTATGTTNINTIRVTYKTATVIEKVDADNAPIEYYNLQGVKVDNPTKGVFIKKQGLCISKIVL